MKTGKSESETDVSSDSSWTVIEETSICNPEENPVAEQNVNIEVIRTTQVLTIGSEDNDFVKVTISESSIKQSSDEESENSKNRENGFLTFDEYLQERMLEHDYDHPNSSIFRKKLRKTKRFSSKKSKCKAETIGVLSLCASLLTVTGIGLMCLIFPENVDTKNFDTIKSGCQAIANNQSLDYNNVVANFNKTMEVLQAANNSEIFAKSADLVMNRAQNKYKRFRRNFEPIENGFGIKSKRRRTMPFPTLSNVCYTSDNNGVCYASEDPRLSPSGSKNQKNKSESSKMMEEEKFESNFAKTGNNTNVIESILANTNLKRIIRSIIHDICILKLITYLNSNKETQVKGKKKTNKGDRKSSKRKLFDTIADGMEKLSYEKNSDEIVKTTKRKNKIKKIKQKKESNSITTLPSTETTPRPNFFLQCPRVTPNFPPKIGVIPKFENGKSECERRFEELDSQRRKSQEVCSKHKTNIQHIKQQYRNEIDAIKDSTVEPMVRLYRIHTLREKYRLQLKRNREIYVKEMSKMKRLRAKMLKDLCAKKRNDLEMRDAAVGSYVVPIDLSFHNRLEQMKRKEKSVESFIEDSKYKEKIEPVFKLSNGIRSDVVQFDLPSIFGGVEVHDQGNQRVCPVGRTSSISGLSSDFDNEKRPSGLLDSSYDHHKGADNLGGIDSYKDLERKKNHLYQVAFEKKGPMIENLDKIKWNQKRNEYWQKYRRDSSKQDPQKCHKPNVMLYKSGKL